MGFKQYKDFIERFLDYSKKKFGQNLLAAALFGSVARNQEKPTSDIDLLFVFDKKDIRLEESLTTLLVEADSWPEKQVMLSKGFYGDLSTITRTRQQLIDDPLILLDIIDQGIILFDPYKMLNELIVKLKNKLQKLGAKKIVLADGSWYWDLKPDWKPGEVVEVAL